MTLIADLKKIETTLRELKHPNQFTLQELREQLEMVADTVAGTWAREDAFSDFEEWFTDQCED